MHKILFPLVMAAAILAGCATSNPPGNGSAAPLQRIQILQAKADEYAAGRTGAAAYAPQKALAWLDLAQDEYYEDDRSGIVIAATDEAEKILRQIEAGNVALPFDTPIIRASEKVRDDLWHKAAQLKQSPDFACAAKQLAQLDVQLVWTGHEYWESGWRHAKTHSEVADNLAYDAEMAIRQCADTARSGAAAQSASTSATADSMEKISFATDALFAFDRAGVDQIVSGGQLQLDALAARLQRWKKIDHINIVGYTDDIGTAAYNQRLSQRRADNVRAYLVKKGLLATQISAQGRGASSPVVVCGKLARPACNQANRRVEVHVEGQQ
jgi:outer membrane protein OmpA-like peptidoglycan-associated protein